MAEVILLQLCDPTAGSGCGAPVRGYGNDKANSFALSYESDAKTPSSRLHDHYIIGVPIEAVAHGDKHDFREAHSDCHLVTTAAFRRVAKTKPGAFDPRKFVASRARLLALRAIRNRRASVEDQVPVRARAELIPSATRAAVE
jgi:hypothetical protein